MKILYVTTISNTINAFLIPHIKFLVEQGNEVGVACNIVVDLNPELKKLGCKIHDVKFQRNPLKQENLTAYRKIKKVVKEDGYELIHVHTPVASLLTRLACRSIDKVKVLYTAHGFHFFKGAPKKNWIFYHTLEKIAARWTDGLITMNEEDYYAAKKFNLRKKGTVFKVNGVGLDFDRFVPQTAEKKKLLRKEYGYQDDELLLIYVGELSYRKHQDHLIEAMGKLKGRLNNVKLLLVGDGDLLDEYTDMIRNFDLEKEVELLGYRKDVHNLMSLSDIAVSSSRQEGLPVNVMEAMATGLPLVVTNCRGNRDLVTDGVNGFVVGVDHPAATANAIFKLAHSEELRNQFSIKNRELIQNYSLNHVIGEMKEIYQFQSSKHDNFSSMLVNTNI
ncbi:glycosyltransferase family 4 protein [Anaerobacillus isosaccharinicus]|uniref:Glycosyltransferase family 1 protein n=1 Tax=Anaerobacillus isosaccharinicus TaxID=1532552 RepID=A0A1S2KZN3_9BACI|nr:glycosyltransferase family 4 protein [Anaerobacillus isosaccharinicus]MBA5586881.1 glycosyltransferase family 4 protein [Anaerobacillus isosaccharinicus]QOY34909.1 glycosyltransferase family 4 protein [Anaerobacillus isosaccharinicus]